MLLLLLLLIGINKATIVIGIGNGITIQLLIVGGGDGGRSTSLVSTGCAVVSCRNGYGLCSVIVGNSDGTGPLVVVVQVPGRRRRVQLENQNSTLSVRLFTEENFT